MKTNVMGVITVVVVFGFAGVAGADVVEVNLFDLGCPAEFNWDTQYWQKDFDLGVEFVEINSVYMDWSGEITAGLAINYSDPCNPFPVGVGIYAGLSYPPLRRTEIGGGKQLILPRTHSTAYPKYRREHRLGLICLMAGIQSQLDIRNRFY